MADNKDILWQIGFRHFEYAAVIYAKYAHRSKALPEFIELIDVQCIEDDSGTVVPVKNALRELIPISNIIYMIQINRASKDNVVKLSEV